MRNHFPAVMKTTAAVLALVTAVLVGIYLQTPNGAVLTAAISCGTACYHFAMRLLLGHLVLGVTRIQEAANELGIQSEVVLLLQHMMLSHHGEPDFGSPRKPMFPEAEALHWIDLLDARMNEMQGAIAKLKPGVFSEKIWSLDRRLYRPMEDEEA